jgi:hypothetical protein
VLDAGSSLDPSEANFGARSISACSVRELGEMRANPLGRSGDRSAMWAFGGEGKPLQKHKLDSDGWPELSRRDAWLSGAREVVIDEGRARGYLFRLRCEVYPQRSFVDKAE